MDKTMDNATDTIGYSVKDHVATITLNRPKQLNAFNEEMHHALKKALDDAAHDDDVRAILLTGAGKGFCAGQDLGDRDPRKQSYDLGETLKTFYNPLMRQLDALHKPKVCAVNGVAAGAGIGIALACDITLAADSAKFAMAFGKIGLLPDSGLTWRLVRTIGLPRAKALVLTNAVLSAEEALSYGLIWQTHPADVLQERAFALCSQLATGAQTGTALTIDALNNATINTFSEQLDLEESYQRKAGYSPEYKEGVTAFLEKRPADFTSIKRD